jgi:glycosyltransferase involved in cell wall biosynthesis
VVAIRLTSVAGADEPIFVLCAMRYGPLGASSRLRLMQYRPFLERAGIHTSLRNFLSDSYLEALYSRKSRFVYIFSAYMRALGARSAARRHDMLWIEKEYLPWLPYWLERWVIGSTPYILDFDDAWSLRYEQAGSPLLRWLFGTKFKSLLRGAVLTVTANDTLYKWASGQGARKLLLLPTVVNLDHYVVSPEPENIFTIGWIGTPLTASYLDVIAEPLHQLAKEAPLRLLIIGAPNKTIPGVDCVHLPWSESTEAQSIGQCHSGIMPLPDTDWARGKSGYKLIQYMAMGRSAVASAVGANRQIIEHGHTGYLASTPEDWLIYLRALRDDPSLRRAIGAAARQRAEKNFSLQVTAPILIDEIRRIPKPDRARCKTYNELSSKPL